MLTALATLAAEILGGLGWIALQIWDQPHRPGGLWRVLPDLMLFSATVTGLACLALTVAVYRVRPVDPPPAITAAVVLISAAPILLSIIV